MYFQNYFARRSIILESFTSHLQHSRPCCIRYTNSRLRLEFVYLIQHGRSCCKYYIPYYIIRTPCHTALNILSINPVTPEKFNKEKSTEDNNTATIAIALGVTFSILLLAGIVIGVVCYRKRRSGTNITPRFLSDFISKIT